MGLYLQAASAVLLTVVLGLTIGKQGKELGTLLTIGVCSMVTLIALNYLEPVSDLLRSLESMAQMQGGMLEILLKAVGIGLISEIAGMVCTDAGHGSLGKVLQILGSAVILWLSIPVFTALMDLIKQIMGDI